MQPPQKGTVQMHVMSEEVRIEKVSIETHPSRSRKEEILSEM